MNTPTNSTASEPIKRFISGAVCPACQAMDSIRLWDMDEVSHRDCVQCGYSDTLNAQGNSIPSELPTRVNTDALRKPKAQKGQAMQFFPNPNLKK